MRYINTLKEGDSVKEIYLCKQKSNAITKNGKPYDNLILADKTGTINGKVWDVNSMGINNYEELDYIEVVGDVVNFNGGLQFNIKGIRVADASEYSESEYVPTSKHDIDVMYDNIIKMINEVVNPYLNKLLVSFFVEDEEFIKSFKKHSAAKTIHHGFVGGLVEHTVSVAWIAKKFAELHKYLSKDLLVTAALLHDIGKIHELSYFPQNDYTDKGQMIGHIVLGYEMVNEKIGKIDNFPEKLKTDIGHLILSHHGELEYGSPKKPAIPEAIALNLADNCDAKLETMKELIENNEPQQGSDWYGYNRSFESNIRKSSLSE